MGWPTVLPHSRRCMQKLWYIHLAMLIHRYRGVKVRIKITVQVIVNPMQIMSRYSHCSRKTKPNSNIALPCLGPSSCLRIGAHRHGHQGSPHASVSCTLNTICNRYSCPLFDIISPASPWSSSTSVSGNDTM